MRLLHISDTHGATVPLRTDRIDAIVHSGDLFPNSGSSPTQRRKHEALWQSQWILANGERLRTWIGDLPFIYCTGNHDYTTGEQELLDVGINAVCINDRALDLQEHTLYGFPWTPALRGTNWNDKLNTQEMSERISAIPYSTTVLVAHGPIGGILSLDDQGVEAGCSSLRYTLDYDQLNCNLTAYLHGHIHESHGVSMYGKMLVSNAATTQHVIELR